MSDLFGSVKLNEEGLKKAEMITDQFELLLQKMTEVCISPREFALMKTKLEEASFFAKKSMALYVGNQAK